MRHWCLPLVLLAAHFLHAQVRINELQCTRATDSDGNGPNGDWVELYNAGNHKVDLGGYALVLDGHVQRLRSGLSIAPEERRVLWCDNDPGHGLDHLGMKLPRKGGTLLLIAPDKITVLDLFSWPSLPPGVSIGRNVDGGRSWGFFAKPSPGGPNGGAVPKLATMPVLTVQEGSLSMAAGAGVAIHYTLDGSLPQVDSPFYTGALELPAGTVVRARSFAPNAVPSPCTVHTVGVPDAAWALFIEAKDLTGKNGIADTLRGNHARKGREWQRQAWLQQGNAVRPVGIAVAGSGSRSLPKRNYKLIVRDRFGGDGPLPLPDGTAWREVILRADATPYAFLRNAFMEVTAIRSGGRLEVQPGFPVPLYLNGQYQGLYRAMPAKGEEWLRSFNGGASVEIIEGPDARPVKGDAEHYQRMLHTLISGAPLDTLGRVVDVASLVELACFDLWTGRADHELNIRGWRPTPQGRWRWVMYDMDLWAPADDRTVQRMCGAKVPTTPFLPELLADGGTRDRLLARLAALGATTLSPDRAALLADSLYRVYRHAMSLDHERWKSDMPSPAPEAAHADLLDHVHRRNQHLFQELARYTGHTLLSINVRVEPADAGSVSVEGLYLTGTQRGITAFEGVPLHFGATARDGMEFAGWKGSQEGSDEVLLVPQRNMGLTAVFRPVGFSSKRGM